MRNPKRQSSTVNLCRLHYLRLQNPKSSSTSSPSSRSSASSSSTSAPTAPHSQVIILSSHQRPPLLSSNYLYLILTVLFLFVSDLAQFNGFKRPAQHIGIMQILLEFLYFFVFVLCIRLLFFWLISSCRFRQDWRCRAIYWAPKKRCFGDPKPPELARAAKKTTLPQISPTPKTRRFLSRIFRLIPRFPHVRISQWNHTCACFPYLFIFPYKSFFIFGCQM